jgi:hypothetical protein
MLAAPSSFSLPNVTFSLVAAVVVAVVWPRGQAVRGIGPDDPTLAVSPEDAKMLMEALGAVSVCIYTLYIRVCIRRYSYSQMYMRVHFDVLNEVYSNILGAHGSSGSGECIHLSASKPRTCILRRVGTLRRIDLLRVMIDGTGIGHSSCGKIACAPPL